MNRPTRTGSLLALAGIASLAFAAGASAGVVSDPFIRITATNGSGVSTFNVPLAAADPSGGMWSYTLPSPVTLSNGAVITQMNSFVRPQAGSLANLISLNITVVAGTTDTSFVVNSALLELVPNVFDAARATAGVSVTDGGGEAGVRFTGGGPLGSGFFASHDGEAPGGTAFATFFTVPVGTAVLGGSANATQQSAGYPTYISLGGSAADMSSMWNFVLTGSDQAAVTSAYFIIPSPGAICLLGLAGLVAARRARK